MKLNTPAHITIIFLLASFSIFAETATPGLIKKITNHDGQTNLTVSRHAALYVAEGEFASPFLAAGKFTAEFTGSLTLNNRERVYFSFVGAGKATLDIDGETVLTSEGDDLSETETSRLRLNAGAHTIKIQYTPPEKGPKQLRLQWHGRGFTKEPVPASFLSHDSSPELENAILRQEGRSLYGQLRCVKCHEGPTGANAMPELAADAPSLAGIGNRLQSGWIKEWLLNPSKLRHNATMPKLAGIGESEANDLAAALGAMTAKGAEPPAASPNAIKLGGGLFHRYGCANCHSLPGADKIEPDRTPLNAVAAKFAPSALSAFLQAPNKHYKWIKMPDFKLDDKEAGALSAFLINASSIQSFPKATGDVATGRKLLKEHNCTACHAGTDIASTPSTPTASLSKFDSACLSSTQDGKAPHYQLTDAQRKALKAFLATPDKAVEALSRHNNAEFAARRLEQLNCNACHETDGQSSKWGTDHGATEAFFNASGLKRAHLDQSRPDLNQVGSKLNTDYLANVIAGTTKTSRPWLDAKMPAFPATPERMAKGLAARQGFAPSTADQSEANQKNAEIGKTLTSSNGGFACNICHASGNDKALAAFEVEGINLARINERLRTDFFMRWMHNPPRITPTTKMPRYGLDDGTTALTGILEGDADAQFKAIWDFLKAGKDLPSLK